MTTINTRLSFGKYSGRRLDECPVEYLQYVSQNWRDSDFHEWAVLAEQVLATRGNEVQAGSLEEQADALLKRSGYGSLVPRRRRRY